MAGPSAAEPVSSSSRRNRAKKREKAEITVTKKAHLNICDVTANVWIRNIERLVRVEFKIYKDHVIVKKCEDLFKHLYRVTASNRLEQRNNSVEEGLVMVFLPLLINYDCSLNMDFMGSGEDDMPRSWFTCVAHLLRSLSATCDQLIIPARKELAVLMNIMDVKAVDLVIGRGEVDSVLPSFFKEEKCKKLYINLVGGEVEGVRKIIQGWQKKQYRIPQVTLANDYASWPNTAVVAFLRLHKHCLKFEREKGYKTSMNFFIGRDSDKKILCIQADGNDLCMYESEITDKKKSLVFRPFKGLFSV